MGSRAVSTLRELRDGYLAVLRWVVCALAVVSGVGFLAMMAATCTSVVLGIFGGSLPGVEDFVMVAGGVAIACALPYTTAVKGHVAVEYFFHKLGRISRVVTDTGIRLLGVALFALLGWGSVQRGLDQQAAGTTTPTLEIPLFWTWYVTAGCCGLVALTVFAHLVRPGRELVRP